MDRTRLERYLAEGLSLIEIGALENRDPSTVGYWVQKYGLVENGRAKYAPRGGIDRGRLTDLVDAGMTLNAIALELDRTCRRFVTGSRSLDSRRPRQFVIASAERP